MNWLKNWRVHRQGELRTDPVRLAAYFADRKLMWRNIILVMIGNLGYGIAFTVITPLMLLKMKACGITEDWLGAVQGWNLWLVSILVMYFSWQSDHLISRFGRRTPYLLISAPPVILTAFLFPFFTDKWVLLGLWIVQMLFIDMKASTYSLIMIDCVPRKELASLGALSSLIPSVCGFFALRYGMRLTNISEVLPYVIGAPIMIAATLIAGFGVVEPPVYSPTKEKFKPWSTMKVAWVDKRIIWLMVGVGTIHTFLNVFGAWVWLFAKVNLGLAKTDTADVLSWCSLISVAMAYPTGWIIDHFGGRRVVVVFWIMEAIMFYVLLHVTTSTGLLAVAILQYCTAPLYCAADIMVWKTAPPEHVGSITSTNSFLRNLIAGTVAMASGQLIRRIGYDAAFVMGISISTFGLTLFFVHKWVMRRRPVGELPAAVKIVPVALPAENSVL